MNTAHHITIRMLRRASRVVLLAGALSSAFASAQAAAKEAPAQGRQIVVLVDFSGSRTPEELAHSREMVSSLVQRLTFGDQMVVLPVAGTDARRRPVVRMREFPKATGRQRDDRRRLDATRSDTLDDVKALFSEQPARKPASTDLLVTLARVRDYVLEAGERRINLIVLSDMIQDAGSTNFTRLAGIPKSEWIAKQKANELVPYLKQACVTIVGAETATEVGIARRTFWRGYFAAAGAKFSNDRYRETLTRFDGALCD